MHRKQQGMPGHPIAGQTAAADRPMQAKEGGGGYCWKEPLVAPRELKHHTGGSTRKLEPSTKSAGCSQAGREGERQGTAAGPVRNRLRCSGLPGPSSRALLHVLMARQAAAASRRHASRSAAAGRVLVGAWQQPAWMGGRVELKHLISSKASVHPDPARAVEVAGAHACRSASIGCSA